RVETLCRLKEARDARGGRQKARWNGYLPSWSAERRCNQPGPRCSESSSASGGRQGSPKTPQARPKRPRTFLFRGGIEHTSRFPQRSSLRELVQELMQSVKVVLDTLVEDAPTRQIVLQD